MRIDWRFAALGGLAAGLAISPLAPSTAGAAPSVAVLLSLVALVALRRCGRESIVWLALLAAACAAAGLIGGAARLRAIDRGAYDGSPGSRVAVHGFVASVPRRTRGLVRVQVETVRGRLLLEAHEPVPELPIGAEVRARGTIAAPPPWYRGYLRRQGVGRILRTDEIDLTGQRRGGLAGRIDALRLRAERALGRGMPDREAALARGFVLGEDDRIDPKTAEAFRRSGLAHLLAVSGQNVLLLALLAGPLLAALGIPLRARLAWLLCLIAVYVPLAGGGPSIQRAGVMGAAGLIATLAGRPASRAYALALAAAVTLALNPLSSGDVGWELSFAAVAGIFLLAAPLRDLILASFGGGHLRRGLADGVAVTVAATVATAPLMALRFGSLSVTSLPANVLALPAVAPAMWLGMLAAAAGQMPGLPVEPLNALNSLLLAYIAQVAVWMGSPDWALATIPAPGWTAVAAAYAVLGVTALVLRRWIAGRETLRARWSKGAVRHLAGLIAIVLAVVLLSGLIGGGPSGKPPAGGLRISVLDVGQGDSILLQPADGDPLLVDGGPSGTGLAGMLEERGVTTLGAAVVTHDQSDHSGGIQELLGDLPVRRFVYANAGRSLIGAAAAAGAVPTRVAEGSEIRSGSLSLEVLWPPRELLGEAPAADPNDRSLVLLARWHRFEMLLTGDAEAESVPMDPGPIDVLKVSHHGSADSGLAELLDRSAPRLAVISVGAGNPFGHPAPATLATLAAHGITVLRTDLDGYVNLDLGRRWAWKRSGDGLDTPGCADSMRGGTRG